MIMYCNLANFISRPAVAWLILLLPTYIRSIFSMAFTQAYDFFKGGQKGHDACVAFFSLTAIGSIDTMIANFLTRWVSSFTLSFSHFLHFREMPTCTFSYLSHFDVPPS